MEPNPATTRCRAPRLCGLSVGVRFKRKGRQRAEPTGKILAGKARVALWAKGTQSETVDENIENLLDAWGGSYTPAPYLEKKSSIFIAL